MAAAMTGFTSCEEDHDSPVYKVPTEFVLNFPALGNSGYILAPGSNVELTCSQPDYGYSAVTNYALEVSLTEEFKVDEETGEPLYYTIRSEKPTQAVISIAGEEWATAILNLMNIKDFEAYPEEGVGATDVYVRALAQLTGIESSKINSNTIKLNMTPFNPYSKGGRKIYITGLNGTWGVDGATPESYASHALTETANGSNVYVGAFDFKAGDLSFRFYTKLGSWGDDGELPSIGSGPNDFTEREVTITDVPTDLEAVPGKGNFVVKNWPGGYITFTITLYPDDPSKVTVIAQAGDLDPNGKAFIYLVGACTAWSVPDKNAEEIYAPFKLYDWEGNGVYSGIFNIDAGQAMFRFYTKLGDWDQGSIGASAEGGDGNVDLSFPAAGYTGAAFEGDKHNWNFTDWAGGNMRLTVDVANLTVTFEAVE